MASRNDLKDIFYNTHPLYAEKASQRGIKAFRQYGFPKFHKLTQEEVSSLTTIGHIWTQGDKYYKLAYEHYGDPEYWWIIAWFNEKPTDAHLNIGDPVYVPVPLEELLGMFYSTE